MTGADLLVASLYEQGVRIIFGMPGSHTTALYDAIERQGGIRTILMRNEQAGAFAADGFARVTGQPGVICTTAGPGATNTLTGIGEAWADSIPVLLLSGQVNRDRLHQECGNYHEIDLESIFRPCTKYVGTVLENCHIPLMVAEAMAALTTGRPRPAALFLPQDLMSQPADFSPCQPPRNSLPTASATDIKKAAALLIESRHPILLAGGGAVWAKAGPLVHQLAQRLHCPVLTSLNGKGILDERDPLSLGHARSLPARVALAHADVMLAIGCRFTEVMTGFRKLQVPSTLIQIDVDKSQIGMNYPVTLALCADVREALQALLDALPATSASAWDPLWAEARSAHDPKPEWLIDTLRRELPEDAVVFTDASEMAYRMHTDFPAYRERSFFYPSNYIALGWGFPAALGAAVALPERAVVSVSGDGGFVMTCQELATAVRYQLRMIIMIHNDNTYGAIKNLQSIKHGSRYRDTDLNNPDFMQLAHAFGVPARRVADAKTLAAALHEAQRQQGPFLIECSDSWRSHRHGP